MFPKYAYGGIIPPKTSSSHIQKSRNKVSGAGRGNRVSGWRVSAVDKEKPRHGKASTTKKHYPRALSPAQSFFYLEIPFSILPPESGFPKLYPEHQ